MFAISTYLNKTGPVSYRNLRNDFNDIAKELKHEISKGITSRMIFYCQRHNISCLGIDQSDKVVIRNK